MITIKGYTEIELQYIIDNFQNCTVKQLSIALNKTYESVSNAVRKLGLKKQKHNIWTEEDIEFLKENYLLMTSEEISKHINHSVDSINTQRNRLQLIRNDRWAESDIQFLKANYMLLTHEEIGQRLNRTPSSVTAKCFDLNLYKKELPWSENEIKYIKKYYMELPTIEISKQLNRTTNAIRLQAQRLGFKKYPYACDYDYFDIIDDEEKAYWLGFLTADGWISKNDKANSGVVGMTLQYSDLSHLKKFNKSLNGNYKITDGWKACKISTRDKEKKNHYCCIRIYSITMYDSLCKLGLSENKSYDCYIPKLPNELIRHYMRGYFDGDGRFGLSNNRIWVAFCTASKQFNDDLIKILKNNSIDIKEYNVINENNVIIYSPEITDIHSKMKFLDWIYKDCNIYLERKYKKYLKAKEKYRTK